jgi:hypothetical protein
MEKKKIPDYSGLFQYTSKTAAKEESMKKQKLLIITALCAMALGGCKKSDPIDIATLHTTAAVEKETLPPTTEAAFTPESSSSSGTVSSTSVQASIQTEKTGSASIQYPVVSNMKDSSMQEKVNALLKANAMAASAAWPGELTVEASVESVNLRRITVTYRGTQKASDGTEHRIFFANTVDLETADNLGLGDLTDIYTISGYIASGDYKLAESVSNESTVRGELNGSGRNTDYYYKLLQHADFTGGYGEDSGEPADWPKAFSYEKAGVIYVSLPVSKEAGDYALIRYSPDNK